jgi:hypothetical protein
MKKLRFMEYWSNSGLLWQPSAADLKLPFYAQAVAISVELSVITR